MDAKDPSWRTYWNVLDNMDAPELKPDTKIFSEHPSMAKLLNLM